MSTRNLPRGKNGPTRRADNLAAILEFQPLAKLRTSTACIEITLLYHTTACSVPCAVKFFARMEERLIALIVDTVFWEIPLCGVVDWYWRFGKPAPCILMARRKP
jgi:hypothetical protein